MRKLLLAVGLLFCLGALVQAKDAPQKATITFNKGTVVKVNGKVVESGYVLAPGDKVEVSGGDATVSQVVGSRVYPVTLRAGYTATVGTQSWMNGGMGASVAMSIDTHSHGISEVMLSLASLELPPPNTTQNLGVAPAS